MTLGCSTLGTNPQCRHIGTPGPTLCRDIPLRIAEAIPIIICMPLLALVLLHIFMIRQSLVHVMGCTVMVVAMRSMDLVLHATYLCPQGSIHLGHVIGHSSLSVSPMR